MKIRYLVYCFAPLLGILSCGGGGGAAGGDGQQRPGANAAKAVRVAVAEQRQLTFYDKFPATVSPLDEVELRPQASGYITRVHFREGEFVRRGQRLYTLDLRRYAADLEQAEAGVNSALADLSLSEKNLARYERLAEAEAIALQTLDQARAEVEVRQQSVEQARAVVVGAQTQLDYAVITAPLSGLTSLNSAKVGTQVSPGTPLLTTISQIDPIGVDVAISQEAIPRVARLEGRSLGQLDSTFRLRLPDNSLYREYGKIYAIGRAVDPRTGTLNVRLEFSNKEGVLRPGMALEAELLDQRAGERLVLPTTALGEEMGEFYVMVKEDSIVRRRKVETGERLRGMVIVLDGLESGDTVVAAGLMGLQDSSKVKISAR